MEMVRAPMATSKPILRGLCAALLCLALAAAAQVSRPTVRHHKVAVEDPSLPPELLQAEAALEKKDYATAETLLKKVVDRDPVNYRAWFDLGFLYNATARSDDSIAAYRKAVAAKPDVFESNLNLGLMLVKANQPEAEQYLRAATKLKPADHAEEGQAAAWLALAHLLEASQPQQAIDAYHAAATLRPTDTDPHLAAAALLRKENKFSEAEQEYKQVLTLEPKSAEALIGIAGIYARGDRLPEAADTLRKLVALRPDYAPAHIELARVLAADGKNDEAITEFQAGLKISPNDTEAQRDLAEVCSAAGKYDQAQPLYQSLLAAHPNDPVLHRSLGQSYMKQRKFAEAQQEFLAAVKLKSDFGAAYGDLAFAADENKDYQLAIKALDARARYLPEIPVTYFVRATAYDHLRAYKEAAVNYHLFLQSANGQFPDQEWQARHRLITIEPKK
jgi:tetratricopeptide (TPR) repeat protein